MSGRLHQMDDSSAATSFGVNLHVFTSVNNVLFRTKELAHVFYLDMKTNTCACLLPFLNFSYLTT